MLYEISVSAFQAGSNNSFLILRKSEYVYLFLIKYLFYFLNARLLCENNHILNIS